MRHKTKTFLPALQKKHATGESEPVTDDEGELAISSAHTCSDTWWTAAPSPLLIKVKKPKPALKKKQGAGKSDFFTDNEGELAISSAHTCSDT